MSATTPSASTLAAPTHQPAAPTHPAPTPTRERQAAVRSSGRRGLRFAMGTLLATDLVGGLLAVRSGVNTWGEAWGPEALLAAPVPMILVQLLLVWLATRRGGRVATAAAGLLAVAGLVSVVSGFFDGGLGNEVLSPGLQAFQYFLLAVTTSVAVLAGRRVASLIEA